MELTTQKKTHSLLIKGETAITGVSEVVSIEEKEIRLIVGEKTLLLTGRGFHAQKLSVEEGTLLLSGEVECVKYGERAEAKSFLKRLFR